MRNNLLSILTSLGLALGVAASCGGDDGGGDDCQAGTEACMCAENNQCFSGLACSAGVCFPDAGETSDTNDTANDTDGDTGTGDSSEQSLCEKTDECNLLMPGTSVQDCSDLVGMCTGELLSSQYADWENEVADCLEFSNCQNFLGCVGELSACPSVEPSDECGPECVYCFFDTETENMCDDSWNGDGVCDCGCQFTDIDC